MRALRTTRTCDVASSAAAMIAVFMALALALVMLSGCKYSSVLTQHTEDPELGVLDEDVDPTYKDNPEAELVLDLAELTLDDAEDQDTQVAMLPHYDPNAPDNGPTKRLVKSKETPHDEEAAEGREEGEADREGQGEGQEGGEAENTNSGEGEGESEGEGDPLEDIESDEQQMSDDGANAGETVVVDPDGVDDDTAKGTVAAVGEYASIAQMLGGAGALAACDKDWLDARASDGCFSGELDKVQSAFKGDGTAAGSCDVDALVSTIQPSVVLWDSSANVPNLSKEEREKLEGAGIKVQAVSHIGEEHTEDYDVKMAVAEVASVLAGASGLQYPPADVLELYNDTHDQVLKACYESNAGYSYKYCGNAAIDQLYQDTPLTGVSDSVTTRSVTVYVDDMFTPSRTKLNVSRHTTGEESETSVLDGSDGVGLSAANSTKSYMLIDYYLQLAGVANNAYDTAKPDPKGRRFILMPGVDSENLGSSNAYGSRSNDTGSAFQYWTVDKDVDANWKQLGQDDFNTVLVANKDIMNAFVYSAKKKNGLYHMENPYTVAVVPSGIAGSWAEGHFDSFLLAPWAFRVQNPENLKVAAESAEAFYKNFLRCSKWSDAVANWDTSATAK